MPHRNPFKSLKTKQGLRNVDARYFIVIRVTRNFCLERDHPGTTALNTKNIILISSSFMLVVIVVVLVSLVALH